jgi:hypothetical protein
MSQHARHRSNELRNGKQPEFAAQGSLQARTGAQRPCHLRKPTAQILRCLQRRYTCRYLESCILERLEMVQLQLVLLHLLCLFLVQLLDDFKSFCVPERQAVLLPTLTYLDPHSGNLFWQKYIANKGSQSRMKQTHAAKRLHSIAGSRKKSLQARHHE